ncbi:MAG: C-terminal target protein, partial [Flavipsychrobacter sp.]|nr:C-terminal target protein [Flavipsychrobacter sp.]
GSQSGFTYDLYRNSLPTPVSAIGTGSSVDFGEQTAAGVYLASATNPVTGCKSMMMGSGTVNVNPVPLAFEVKGGGKYCTGFGGIAVTLAGSENDVNYQLYNGLAMMGSPVGGTGSGITFGLQTMAGTAYTVRATNNTTHCASDMTGSVSVTPVAPIVPLVAIDSADGTACVGDVILYVAHPTNGGTAPTYTWKVNSVVVSTTGDRYMNIPATGDVVSVEMVSNEMCALTAPVTASIKMTSIPYATPTASVSVAPGTAVCQGTPVHMTATTTVEGAKPGYSWMKNGVFVGSGTSYTYTPTNGNDKDVIVFMLRSDYRCRVKTDDTVFSDPVVMTVDTGIAPKFEITASFGPIGSVGQIDTFTVTIDKDPLYQKYSYTYQWYIEGTAVPGADQPVYIDHGVYNNDVVSCQVTKLGACGNQSTTHETTVVLKNVGTQQVLKTIGDVSVIPNPNKGEFTVKGTIGNSNEAVSLEITNMLGQTIYTSNAMTHDGTLNEHIKLSNTIANGMYLLNVRSGNSANVLHIVIEQ